MHLFFLILSEHGLDLEECRWHIHGIRFVLDASFARLNKEGHHHAEQTERRSIRWLGLLYIHIDMNNASICYCSCSFPVKQH